MWLVLLFLFGVIIFFTWCLSSPFYWRRKKIPYLIPLPLIGNCFPIFTKGIRNFLISLQNKFPGEKYYGFHLFSRPALYIKDPEFVQRILVTDFEHFTSHGLYGNQDRDPAGSNLFHVHGQQWKVLRAKLSTYFTPAKVKAMLGYAENTIPKAILHIEENIAKEKPADFHLLMMKVVTDIITQSILGIETDVFRDEKSIYMELANGLFQPSMTARIFLGLLSPKLFDLFKQCILEERNNKHAIDIVTKTMEYRRKNNVQMPDFLQGMMELMDADTQTEQKYFPDNTRVPRYNLNTLISQAIILLLAGTDTSASTMTYLLYEFAVHPDIQEKCREEIAATVQQCGADIVLAELPKLTYFHAAIQETLRLYSPIIMLPRMCTKNYNIPGTDVVIDKGTLIISSPSSMHLDPLYFSEPETFRPERFFDGAEIPTGSYIPFGLGPRTCLGTNFAYNEIKLVIARLLQRYRFLVCSKTEIPVQNAKYQVFTVPANGMWLNVERINKH